MESVWCAICTSSEDIKDRTKREKCVLFAKKSRLLPSNRKKNTSFLLSLVHIKAWIFANLNFKKQSEMNFVSAMAKKKIN